MVPKIDYSSKPDHGSNRFLIEKHQQFPLLDIPKTFLKLSALLNTLVSVANNSPF